MNNLSVSNETGENAWNRKQECFKKNNQNTIQFT